MNARARSLWLLPFVLSACAAEPGLDLDAGSFDAGVADSAIDDDDDDAGYWQAPPPTYAPTFSAIYFEVLDLNYCTSVFCHGGGGITLDFSTVSAAHAALVGQAPTGIHCADRGLILVTPGDPDASLLLAKVRDTTPPCGSHMPPIEGYTLNARELTQIREWILLGAPNN